MSFPTGVRDTNGNADAGHRKPFEVEEQLALDDDESSLPWLEDDDEYQDEGAFDARLIWFALIGLVVIGALLFGAWWFLRDRPDTELLADGSTIEAPDGPYKERPEEPGGREVEGTGDTAFEVSEGQTRRGRLADDTTAPAPVTSAPIDAKASDEAVPSGAVYVQIGAFTSRSDASDAWVRALGRYSALSGLRHRIVEAQVNGATVYRLQAIAPNRAAGDATCRAIRNAGGDCYIR